MAEINHPVVYKSQWDNDAGQTDDDCGPACIAMELNYQGEQLTIDQVFAKTGAGKNQLISIAQMQNAISQLGYTSTFYTGQTKSQLISLLDSGYNPIALVHYGDFSSRQDKGFSGGHFMLVVGYQANGVYVNDPDFWGNYRNDGDHHFYTWADFLNGWNNCPNDGGNPANSYLVIAKKHATTTPSGQTMEIDAALYPKLIDKCNNRDDLYKYLGTPLEPIETNIDKPKAVIEGYKNLATGLDRQLAEAKIQVENYKEKAERIEQTYASSATTDKERITALEKAQIAWEKERESLKGQIESFAVAKGEIAIELATQKTLTQEWKAKYEQAVGGMTDTLTIGNMIVLLLKKLMTGKLA